MKHRSVLFMLMLACTGATLALAQGPVTRKTGLTIRFSKCRPVWLLAQCLKAR